MNERRRRVKTLASHANKDAIERTGGERTGGEKNRVVRTVSECDVVVARGSRRLLTVGVVGDGYPECRGNACAAPRRAAPSLALSPHTRPLLFTTDIPYARISFFFSLSLPPPSICICIYMYISLSLSLVTAGSGGAATVTYCPSVFLNHAASGRRNFPLPREIRSLDKSRCDFRIELLAERGQLIAEMSAESKESIR